MHKKTVLIIDDDSVTRQLIRHALTRGFGCSVIEAKNGREGLIRAEQELPDLVLLDYTMPLMNGKEVLERFRAHPQLRNLPVIVLTAASERSIVMEMASLGIFDYLVKPINMRLFVERVEKVLSPVNTPDELSD